MDVKLLFEKWSEGKNFEDLVTLFFSKRERGRESKQSRRLVSSSYQFNVPTFGILAASQCKVTRQIRPEVMGTFSNCNRSRSMSHTHGDAVKQKQTHSLSSHKSISSTEAGEQKRLASIRAPAVD